MATSDEYEKWAAFSATQMKISLVEIFRSEAEAASLDAAATYYPAAAEWYQRRLPGGPGGKVQWERRAGRPALIQSSKGSWAVCSAPEGRRSPGHGPATIPTDDGVLVIGWGLCWPRPPCLLGGE